MELRTAILGALSALLMASPAGAEWVSPPGANNEKSMRATATSGGKTLSLSCLRTERNIFFGLNEGPSPEVSTEGEPSIMMWIKQPDGRTSRHPIDGQFLDWEMTFIGKFVTNAHVLDQFATGAELSITNSSGDLLFVTDMIGTSAVRQLFKRHCGK